MQIFNQQNKARFTAVIFLISIVIFILGLVLAFKYLRPGSYFAPNPTIDTEFAAGYQEDAFDSIQIGMDMSEVEAILGEPLTIDLTVTGGERWNYTSDNATSFWDFAWLTREVYFNAQGKVEMTKKEVRYD